MFKRKAFEELKQWKKNSNGRTAALIEGARRIGKTTVAKAFAEQVYADFMVLDFSLEGEDVRRLFLENLGDPDAFFRNLFLLKGRSLPKGEAAIILDEVQLFPQARQAVKALVADGRYDYIETGSLISIRRNVKDILIPSEEHRIAMHPMDFEEFLWAIGNEVAFPALAEAFAATKPLGDAVHRRMLKDFRSYVAVGGMPQAVALFVQGATFEEIDLAKRSILQLYEEDINKFGPKSGWASSMFRSIPEQLTRHGARFMVSKLDKNARYGTIADSLRFLDDSMTVNECIDVTAPEVLMDLSLDRSNFKLYMADTGLLVTQAMGSGLFADESLYKSLILGRLGANLGMVMENAVSQMLVANGHPLRYHEFRYKPKGDKREKTYEIDFLVVRNGKLCPLEVKSSGYRTHKSLDCFFQKYDVKSQERYVLYTKDLMREGNVVYLPMYMAACL